MSWEKKINLHPLYDNWVLFAHLPHDTNWSLNSYKTIQKFKTNQQTKFKMANVTVQIQNS